MKHMLKGLILLIFLGLNLPGELPLAAETGSFSAAEHCHDCAQQLQADCCVQLQPCNGCAPLAASRLQDAGPFQSALIATGKPALPCMHYPPGTPPPKSRT